ncbi:MAG: M55 family metallopeptidase, partial [Gammaproteobacteria bacterium]|nr:M55 family metallopeptidase [Gammaproteobacteria bacterium]
MRVFISVDMEGISGLVRWQDVVTTGLDYARARRFMTQDTNAAIAGAFDGGATEVIVEENHGVEDLCNLLMDEIDDRCRVIRGAGRPHSTTMAGLDATIGVVLLIGLWFDGGLFTLATASVVWVLLELGRGTALPACRGQVEADVGTPGQVAHAATNPPAHVGGYTFPVSCRSCVSWLTMSLVVVLVLTGLFWARARDPFQREWFSVRTSSGKPVAAAVVMPDSGGPFPVVVWCH